MPAEREETSREETDRDTAGHRRPCWSHSQDWPESRSPDPDGDESDHTDRSLELREALTFGGIKDHLERFQAFADISDGNRASGFPGFDLSADYVARKLDNYNWRVRRQPFDFDVFIQDLVPSVFEQTAPDPATYVENELSNEGFSTMEYSGSGDVTAELVAVDLTLPPDPEPSSDSGCEAEDFTGLAGNDGADAARHLRLRRQGAERHRGGSRRGGDLQRGPAGAHGRDLRHPR